MSRSIFARNTALLHAIDRAVARWVRVALLADETTQTRRLEQTNSAGVRCRVTVTIAVEPEEQP